MGSVHGSVNISSVSYKVHCGRRASIVQGTLKTHDHRVVSTAARSVSNAIGMHVASPSHPHCVQDILALGAIFATTDSVAVLQVLNKDRSPILFSLVFGEGVINDAAGVALLRAIQVSCIAC